MKSSIKGYQVCEYFDDTLFDSLIERYKTTKYKDIAVVEIDDGVIIVFPFGAYVAWNISYENIKFFEDFIEPFQVDSTTQYFIDEFEYTIEDRFDIHFDSIVLPNNDVETKIALSSAIAQNIKLMQYEEQISSSIEKSSSIPKTLASTGKIQLSRKQISKKIGELFMVKSRINLHYDLLDTPEFFWDYPEYEIYYEKLSKYLDIKQRIDVLNKKVEVVQELLDMLSHEQNHRYSSFLEWIIIILIGVEIVMSVWEHFIK